MSSPENARGKSLAEYRFDPDNLTPAQEDLLARDVAWENFDLGLTEATVRLISVEQLFETGEFASEAAGSG